jgi:hypothetical protein
VERPLRNDVYLGLRLGSCALFGGDGEITDAMFEEVKNFAAFVKAWEEAKQKE